MQNDDHHEATDHRPRRWRRHPHAGRRHHPRRGRVPRTVHRRPARIRPLLERLQEVEDLATVEVEGTNSYGAEVTRVLQAAGLNVLEVLRPTRQVRRINGKSNPVDAIAAARSLLVTAPDSVRAPLRDLNDRELITRLAACRPGSDMADPATATKHSLKLLARDYQRLNTEADGLTDQMKQLVTTIHHALVEVFGSGTITSAQLLVTAGDTRQPRTDRHRGPVRPPVRGSADPASSSKTRRFRLNRGGDCQANAAMHRIARVHMSHEPHTRAYVERRTDENRSKKEIPLPQTRHRPRDPPTAARP